jgi:predicted DNA-binding transcriptional regulator AlpA
MSDSITSELLDRRAVAALLGIGASTFDRLRASGKIGPQPVRLGGAIRWHRPEVLAWLAHRDPACDLYDADTWPAVWAAIRTRVTNQPRG